MSSAPVTVPGVSFVLAVGHVTYTVPPFCPRELTVRPASYSNYARNRAPKRKTHEGEPHA